MQTLEGNGGDHKWSLTFVENIKFYFILKREKIKFSRSKIRLQKSLMIKQNLYLVSLCFGGDLLTLSQSNSIIIGEHLN